MPLEFPSLGKPHLSLEVKKGLVKDDGADCFLSYRASSSPNMLAVCKKALRYLHCISKIGSDKRSLLPLSLLFHFPVSRTISFFSFLLFSV